MSAQHIISSHRTDTACAGTVTIMDSPDSANPIKSNAVGSWRGFAAQGSSFEEPCQCSPQNAQPVLRCRVGIAWTLALRIHSVRAALGPLAPSSTRTCGLRKSLRTIPLSAREADMRTLPMHFCAAGVACYALPCASARDRQLLVVRTSSPDNCASVSNGP